MGIQTGKLTKGYGIYFDLSGGQKITDLCSFESEEHYNEVVKSLKSSYASSNNKPPNYVEVGIKDANNVVEDTTFDSLRARLFQK